MRVFVTGGGGFLGTRVVDALIARGHSVRALIRNPTAAADVWGDGVEVVRGDLRRGLDVEALAGCETVIHLAAAVSGSEEQQFANTVAATERLLDAVGDSHVRRIVLAGSMSVYDWTVAGSAIDESTPLEADLYARDGYAIAKTWQERVVRRFAAERERQLAVLRPGFIWGPGRMDNAGIGQRIGSAYLVFGPGRRLPLTYVENCADAFVLAAEAADVGDLTANVVDSDAVTAGEYASRLIEMDPDLSRTVAVPALLARAANRSVALLARTAFGHGATLPGLFVPRRFDARFRDLAFPSAVAHERLGWQPRIPFEQALSRVREVGA